MSPMVAKVRTWTSDEHLRMHHAAGSYHAGELTKALQDVSPSNIRSCCSSNYPLKPGSVLSENSIACSKQPPLCPSALNAECGSNADEHGTQGNSAQDHRDLHSGSSGQQHCTLHSESAGICCLNSCERIHTHGVIFENDVQKVTSNSTTPKRHACGHLVSSGDITVKCNKNSNSLHQLMHEEPVKLPPATGKNFQVLEENNSANHLLVCGFGERKHFIWAQSKAEIICIFVSFNLLLALIVEAYWITGRGALLLICPWFATGFCASLLLGALLLDFVRSQTLCIYVSPLLFLSAYLSWLIPGFFLDVDPQADSGFFATMGFLISVSLPWLLSAAPIMERQATVLLCLVMPFVFFATFFTRLSAIEFSMDFRAIFPIVALLATTNMLLWHLRSSKFLRVLRMVDAWAFTFREERERDNADRISRMRHFISYIFHEIRVPFNAVVLGIGHLLASEITNEQHEILNMMDFSSSSMIHILNDVLDMGKIEAGKLHLEKQPFNMGEMVSSLVWAFKDTMDSKGITFDLCIDPTTKQLLSRYDLLGDKHRVCQVLANYLSNATKFTPCGGRVTLRIVCTGISIIDSSSGDGMLMEEKETSRFSRNGKCLAVQTTNRVASITVAVADTGIGISKEDQEILFEPYIQISASSSQGGGGTGLGLSFAKRIVELAGGNIGVFSEVGKGSIFEFTIPFQLVECIKDRDNEEMKRSSADMRINNVVFRSSSVATSLACKPKVLIVEDNVLNRKIIRKLLESLNLDSDDAENGKQAVKLVAEGRSYDMILVDKEMPVMDGHEATRQLRAMGVKSPIIGLTGNALNSDRNAFIAAGVDDFFTKPISRHQLVKLLEAYDLIPKTKEKLQMPACMLQNLESVQSHKQARCNQSGT